jgi:3-deoxy-D-manno-octulosonic-acid transferase
METLIFYSYRCLFLVVSFVLRIGYFVLPKGKLKQTLFFRIHHPFTIKPTFNQSHPTICVHAASGEIEYAYPLIRKIKELQPQYNILVTLSSPSVLYALKNSNDIDAFGPAPIDTFFSIRRFLFLWSPKYVLFSRTDVWPEFSYQLSSRKIPSYLFSCTLSEKSSKVGLVSQGLTKFCFNRLTGIYTVGSEDKMNLMKIGIKVPIEILGDTRFDQIELKKKSVPILKNLFPINSQQEDLTQNNDHAFCSKKIFVAGSTWEEDERILFPVFKNFHNWKWIVAPHEVNKSHLDSIKNRITKEFPKAKLQFYSDFDENADWDILIVDQFGLLFYLYQYADISFVGGSFKDKVHSVMEPLAYNKYVTVGPKILNNREALEFSKMKLPSNLNMVQVINHGQNLENILSLIDGLTPESKLKDFSKINDTMTLKRNATDRVYTFIFNKS